MKPTRILPYIIIGLSFLTYFLIPGLYERANTVINQELISLLHPEDQAAREYKNAQLTFKAMDLTLVIFNHKDPKAVDSYMQEFESNLERRPLPHTLKVIKDIKDINLFFDKYAPLYIPADVYDHIIVELSKDQWLNGPKTKRDEVSLKEEKGKALISLKRSFKSFYYKSRHTQLSKLKALREGRFISEDGQTGLLIIMHPTALSSFDKIEEFSLALNQKIADTHKSTGKDVNVMISGDTNNYFKEYQALWSGFGDSVTMTLVLTFIVLYALFRNVRSILLVGHALLSGMVLAAFFILTLFHEINSNSMFLLVVVMGNAVNSNIVFMHYYLCSQEETDLGKRAMLALKKSFWPTSFAVAASCIMYLSFYMGDFRGYQDMALVGIIGMSTTWISGIVILYSLFLTPLAQFKSKELNNYFRARADLWSPLYSSILRFHRPITFASILVIIVAGFLMRDLGRMEEKDMTQLKDKDYVLNNLESLSTHLKNVGLSLDFLPQLVVVTKDRKSALSLQTKISLDNVLRSKLPALKTFTIASLLPQDQDKTVEAMERLKRSYPMDDIIDSPYVSEWQEKLTRDAFAFDQQMRVKEEDIPQDLRSLFIDQDGNYGNVIYLSFNLNRLERNIDDMKFVVKRLKDLGGDDLYMAGTIPLLASIEAISTQDRSQVFWICITLVLITIVFFNLKTRRFLAAYLFAFVGIAATFFLYLELSGTKINILNFLALPMTVALGIDYISNYAQGFDLGRDQDHIRSKTFTMVATMSFTTMASYLSIYFTTPQLALKSFAKIAFVGEAITLFGGMIFFFALLTFQEKIRAKKT